MEFRILGPLEVVADGRPLAIAPGHQRTILALLVVHANRVLTPDRIADEVWGDELPTSGTKALAYHVSRLRDALAPGRRRGAPTGGLETESGGYVLRVDPDAIDAVRFERLARAGHERLHDDPAGSRATLGEALELWRGEPLVDVAYAEFAQAEIRRLQELFLSALEDRIDADLALGDPASVLPELAALLAAHPLRDRLRALGMLALYRAGRQPEALRLAGDGRRLLAQELGIDPSPELVRLEARILAQDPGLERSPAAPPAPGRARNPYKGLRAFTEADSGDFFGREALVGRLLARLEQVARDGRLLVVVGPSGSGKSSVVRAGLVPALRAGAIDGSSGWRIAVMAPGADPFRELAGALGAAGVAPAAVARATAPSGGARDCRPFRPLVADGSSRLLLVVDQLEELYTATPDAERERFLAALVAELLASDGRLLCVATLRADFFDRPLANPDVGEVVRRGVEVVTPLTRAELERAVVRPAEGAGAAVEAGLAADVAADVAHEPGGLPLLQYALTDLFERSDGRHLTRDGYAAGGGALGALGRRADEAWAALDDDGREVARQVLLALVRVGPGGEATTRRVPRRVLRTLADDPGRVDAVLDELGHGRLLTFDRDLASGEPTVEVAHEALLRHWPRLDVWIDEARQDLWLRRRLAEAAAEWEAAGRPPELLAAGSRLDQLEASAADTRLRLADPERAYLAASRAQRATLRRRARASRLRLAAAVAGVAVVGIGLAALLAVERGAAVEKESVAAARELAASSVATLAVDPQLALLLALEASAATEARGYVVEEAYDALQWSLQDAPVAYPAGPVATSVRQGPDGAPRGAVLLAPDELMRLAAANVRRPLTPGECRAYLRRPDCAPVAVPPPDASPLAVWTAIGTVPAPSLAVGSLAGTAVRVLSELPADASALLEPLGAATGIAVAWDPPAGGSLADRLASGGVPDVAIVARPSLVAAAAQDGRLLDVGGLVDVDPALADAGTYLAGLGTVAADGTWPDMTAGGRYGVPFAASVDDLLWYPAAAFAAAGYVAPTTPAELDALVAAIAADGRTPWCLGLDEGGHPGTSGPAWVEDFLLDRSGPDAYDRWVAGALAFDSVAVRAAFEELGRYVLEDGAVLGGSRSAGRTPESMAALPMLQAEPRCWLYRGSSADRPAFRGPGTADAAAVPFPAGTGQPHVLLGRAYEVVVLRDRPEVRRVVEALVGREVAAALAAELGPAGIFPLRRVEPAGDAIARALGARLRVAVDDGRFRVRAVDLLPAPVAVAFRDAVAGYLDLVPPGLDDGLWAADDAWAAVRASRP